jgi:hypothetical protein
MIGPLPWFVTWLPGDPRGFQTRRGRRYVPPPRRYARPGEEVYTADDYRELFDASARLSRGAVLLPRKKQHVALDAKVKRIDVMRPAVRPALIVFNRWHIHFIARFIGVPIRRTVGQFKQAASIALGPPPAGRPRWWVEGCHMKSLPDRRAVLHATEYLWGHVDQGDLYHSWIGDWGRKQRR